MLNIDWNLIFNIINILILYILLRKFLFGPVTDLMEKRKRSIESAISEAENKKKDAIKQKQHYDKVMENAEEKAKDIVKEAIVKTNREHEKQIVATKEEIDKLRQEANKAIELEKKRTMQEVQTEIAGLAIAAAEKLILKNINDDSNRQILNDFLSKEGLEK